MSLISMNAIVLTNKTESSLAYVLEPEGDVVHVPAGQSCRIVPAATPAKEIECEFVVENDKSITLFLAATKTVYLQGQQIR